MTDIPAGEPDPEAPGTHTLERPDDPGASLVRVVASPGAVRPKLLTGTEKRIAAGSVVAGAMLTLLVLMTRAGVSAGPPPPRPALPPAPAPALVLEAAGSTSGWSDANRDEWVGGPRAVAYEVTADQPVSLWMRTVRPSLVVRCEGSVLDVFVFTDSAARIEPDTPDHTVRLRIDDEEETSVLWLDADTHDALFAPDAAKFADRLAQARTLQFGFTPHNAEPVTMKFAVAGLAPLLERASCESGVRR